MRVVRYFTLTMAVFAVIGLAAENDLAVSLLAARNAEEQVALLRGHVPEDLETALDTIEKTAGARFDAKDYPVAEKDYEVAVSLAKANGDTARLPLFFRRIGLSHSYQGQSEPALASFREGIEASEKVKDDVMLAENLHGAANTLQRLSRLQEALPLCEREYAITVKVGQPDAIVRALATYSQTLGQLGRLREALPLNEKAVEVAKSSTRPADYWLMTGNLAVSYAELGDLETALRLELSVPSPTPYDLDSIAVIEVQLHREAEAEVAYRAAIAAAALSPNLWKLQAVGLINLATMQRRLKRSEEARTTAGQALAIAVGQHDPGNESLALSLLSGIAADQHDPATAVTKAADALRWGRESGNPEIIVNAVLARAHAFDVSGQDADAVQAFREAIAIIENRREETPPSAAGLQGELVQWMPSYQAAVDYAIRAQKHWTHCNWRIVRRLAYCSTCSMVVSLAWKHSPIRRSVPMSYERAAPLLRLARTRSQSPATPPGPGSKKLFGKRTISTPVSSPGIPNLCFNVPRRVTCIRKISRLSSRTVRRLCLVTSSLKTPWRCLWCAQVLSREFRWFRCSDWRIAADSMGSFGRSGLRSPRAISTTGSLQKPSTTR